MTRERWQGDVLFQGRLRSVDQPVGVFERLVYSDEISKRQIEGNWLRRHWQVPCQDRSDPWPGWPCDACVSVRASIGTRRARTISRGYEPDQAERTRPRLRRS